MTVYPVQTLTRTILGQLCAPLPITAGCDTAWNQTRVCIVMPLALRCSALDCCATLDLLSQLVYN
jgi:hypothetical protein